MVQLVQENHILCKEELKFYPIKAQSITKGDYNDGTLDKFSVRLMAKVKDKRLDFLFGKKTREITFEEVLSITVSLISRLIFEYGYYYKRYRCKIDKDEKINNDVPVLLVYEEAPFFKRYTLLAFMERRMEVS